MLLGSSTSFLSHQADATHDRVVKREDGERLAKVKNWKNYRSSLAEM